METCKYSKKCGGCVYMGKTYAESLAAKQKMVEKLISPYCRVTKIIGMDSLYHYRNKVHAVIAGDGRGNVFSGTYEQGSHRVVPIDKCLIDNEKADEIITDIVSLMKSFKYVPYNEDSGRGFLRHILIRVAEKTGQIMVTLVVATHVFPSKNNFIKALLKIHPEISTIIMNVNNKKTSMVLGEKEQVLYGKGYIEDKLCGRIFRISSKSFYQINHDQTEILYNTAIELANFSGKENVIDAYSGIGTIGMALADKVNSVTGIELNRNAVADATANARRNNLTNVKYLCGDAGEFMEREAASGKKYDVVLMDPPRSGSTPQFISSVAKMSPQKVVYISCNPETLARDLGIFREKGYKAIECRAVDMFGWTGHVETVVLLSTQKTSRRIDIEIKTSEVDITKSEAKATYEEIKEYVFNHSQLKVSNLYIAQVKAKYGIIERENYNLPKSSNSRQPKCPKEKENAIISALKYYKMIE